MIRKGFLMLVGVCLITLLIVGIVTSLIERSRFEKVTAELNNLARQTIEIVGENPTPLTIAEATQFLDSQKDQIKEKIQKLKNEGKLKKDFGSELVTMNLSNREKFAALYDKLVAQSYTDVEKSNQLTQKLIEAKSIKEIKDLERQAHDQNEKNKKTFELINAMDRLTESYTSIIEN